MLTRRALLAGGAVLPVFAQKRPVLVYAGSYSNPQGPEGSKGNGKGIYLFEMNPATGALAEREVFPSDANPSWLALNREGTVLYSANETSEYQGKVSGSVTAWSVTRATGHLQAINTVSSEGAGPAHLSVHPAGHHVLVANYHGGTVAVLPVLSGGRLGAATDVQHNQGKIGSIHAASGPPGSFAISGHDRPHAHMIESDPTGRFVVASDLGLDQLLIWRFDAAKGKLQPAKPPSVALPTGDGPRHFTFHPNGRWFYCLQEEASTLVLYDWNGEQGRLTARQTLSTLPSADPLKPGYST
ncbi:MAG: lactonase family protein, partial [Bryobacteraceae bacterium]